MLHETDEEENRKVLCALHHDFRPLLCIGETGKEKSNGISEEVLRIQLKIGLSGVTMEELSSLMIAYEPVWAIGVNGIPAEPAYVKKIHGVIRSTLVELFDTAGYTVPILYGGSVNDANCESLIVLDNVDGLFIGRSAWDADNFDHIIRKVLKKLDR